MFLLHIALEVPLVIQGLLFSHTLPFIELNNTVMVVLKVCAIVRSLGWYPTIPLNQMYSTLSAASCVMALLCFGLPGTSSFRQLI